MVPAVTKSASAPGGRLEWNPRIRPVDLIQVDVVGAERIEALLDAAADPRRARVALHAVGGRPERALGGDDHSLARHAFKRGGQQPFGCAEPVALGGTEQIDAAVRSPPDRADAGLLSRRP